MYYNKQVYCYEEGKKSPLEFPAHNFNLLFELEENAHDFAVMHVQGVEKSLVNALVSVREYCKFNGNSRTR